MNFNTRTNYFFSYFVYSHLRALCVSVAEQLHSEFSIPGKNNGLFQANKTVFQEWQCPISIYALLRPQQALHFTGDDPFFVGGNHSDFHG